MSAVESFKFGRAYWLRPASHAAGDLEVATVWTRADHDHAGTTAPEFWLEQRLGRDSYLLHETGEPLFFFKLHWWYRAPGNDFLEEVTPDGLPRIVSLPFNGMERCTELHIQFAPQREGSERLAQALIEGENWLEQALKGNRVRCMFFASRNAALIQFAIKRLGFKEEKTEPGTGTRLFKALG
jgi:hypothetical protein